VRIPLLILSRGIFLFCDRINLLWLSTSQTLISLFNLKTGLTRLSLKSRNSIEDALAVAVVLRLVKELLALRGLSAQKALKASRAIRGLRVTKVYKVFRVFRE
jgi:hypothetical protein